METLNDYRKSIDNLDNAIISILAERFKVTNKVGVYKAGKGLPAKDLDREKKQFERIEELAKTYGLDASFARKFLEVVIEQVVENHNEIALRTNSIDY